MSLIRIGGAAALSEYADRNKRITNKFKRQYRRVSMIPVDFNLLFDNMFKSDQGSKIIELDYKNQIEYFRHTCKAYKVIPDSDNETSGVFINTNSNTVGNEDFANTYTTNKIEEGVNSISNKMREMKHVKNLISGTRSTSSNFFAEGNLENLPGGEMLADMLRVAKEGMSGLITSAAEGIGAGAEAGAITEGLGNVADVALSLIGEGKHISLPKIWEGSTYDPALDVRLKLVSPYGDPIAIKNFIIKPLTILLILVSPYTTNSITYGGQKYFYVHAPGLSNINLGYVANINVTRGGSQVATNKWRQPIELDVSLTIKSALPGFAVMHPNSKTPLLNTFKTSFTANHNDSADSILPPPSSFAITELGNVFSSLVAEREQNSNLSSDSDAVFSSKSDCGNCKYVNPVTNTTATPQPNNIVKNVKNVVNSAFGV